MKDPFENYKKWCKFLGREDSLRLPQDEPQEEQQTKLLYMGLYLPIWGEVANVRILPKCLCYIFHNDNYLVEALKMCNLLEEFNEDHGMGRPTILGLVYVKSRNMLCHNLLESSCKTPEVDLRTTELSMLGERVIMLRRCIILVALSCMAGQSTEQLAVVLWSDMRSWQRTTECTLGVTLQKEWSSPCCLFVIGFMDPQLPTQ
ncbi:hypothetical protein QN277_025885 [Acacia crassicarpa]|nr:hypothetical protein QN277_025885 [Acacia crassicarpa]